MIEVKQLSYAYAKDLVLRDVSFTVQANEIVGILGLSGSGKTTLLKILSGLLKPKQGSYLVEGNDVFASIDELVKYTTITEAILDLKAGGIDAIVADEIFARYAVSKEADQYQVATEVFNSENYGIGFRLEDVALRDKVDAIIDEMAADGTATDISMKWFGEDLLKR